MSACRVDLASPRARCLCCFACRRGLWVLGCGSVQLLPVAGCARWGLRAEGSWCGVYLTLRKHKPALPGCR